MPPKKENKNGVQALSGEGEDGVHYSQGDVDFIMACLKHATGGTVHVDVNKVAEAKGFSNPRSVSNRILALKKKYGIPLGSGKPMDPDAPVTPKGRKLPAKLPSSNRVIKARASPKKATPRKAKGGKAKKEESDAEAEAEVDVDADAGAESVADSFLDDDRLDVDMYQVDDNGNPFSYKARMATPDTEHEKQMQQFYQKALEKAAEDEANEVKVEEDDYV